MAQPLPVEHAWTLIADGLQIHRFYLHVDPLLRRQAAALVRESGAREPVEPEDGRDALAASVDELALRTLLPGDGRAQAGYSAPVGASTVVVLPVKEETPSPGSLAFRIDSSAPSTPARFTGAVRMLDRTGLRFLPELAVRFVLEASPHGTGGPGTLHAHPMHAALPRTVVIRPTPSELDYAEALLAMAARHFLYLFFLIDRPAPPDPHHGVREALGPSATLFESVVDTYADAVRLRFLEAVLGDWHLPPADLHRVRDRARALREGIAVHLQATYAAIDRIGDVRVVDLLETSIPGERRFAKFMGGGGPGQSS